MSTDAVIMLRRNFKHTLRNPIAVFNAILLPVVIMLMFVYMLGNAFSVGVRYIDYATPGMILLAICYGLSATASQAAAKAVAAMMPIAPSQSRGVAGDRNPSAKAIPMMTTTAIEVLSTVATT